MDCQEYRIGRFHLQPFRELLDGGTPVTIGRKALELLSVLAKAQGALVTKDELMTAVWPNTVVEDNAMQVHIVALRKVLGADAELLSTVHGYGYRLAATPVAATPAPATSLQSIPAPPAQRRVGVRVALAVGSVLSLSAAGLWFSWNHLPWVTKFHEARVAVLPFDAKGEVDPARRFADGLQDEILNELSDNHIQAVSRIESAALRGPAAGPAMERLGADLLLDGTVDDDGKTVTIHLFIDDARERVTIWSDTFHGSADAVEALQARVATQAADVVHWAKTGRSGNAQLDAATLASFVAGRESTTGVRNGSNGAALTEYKKVVAAAPDFSWGHSGVAVTYAFMSVGQPPSGTGPGAQLRAQVRQEARRALELDPHNGEAYTALELALPPLDWKAREDLLVQGASMDPSFEPGIMMEGRLLAAVGRGREALGFLSRAHELDPLHNGASWSLAFALAEHGRMEQAHALVSQMQKQWPDQVSTRDARFWVSLADGATDELLAQLADPTARPVSMDQQNADLWTAGLKARATPDPATKADAIRQIRQAGDAGILNRANAMTLLAMLGDIDGAFAQAEFFQPVNPYSAPHLFISTTAAMRADPRFMLLARKFGFVAYWRETGHWPDFCSEPGLPYDCHIEANRIVHTAAAKTRSPF